MKTYTFSRSYLERNLLNIDWNEKNNTLKTKISGLKSYDFMSNKLFLYDLQFN